MRSLLRTLLVALCLTTLLAGCDTFAPSITHAALGMERWRSDLSPHEIALPDGTRIAYLEGGSGEPLVLVHGFGADKDNFTRIARFLTPHYRVIAPDVVGFGDSSHPADADYHYAAQAARLRTFVQALGLTRVHLGGNSMGGGIVMSYAAQHPQEVGSLWLLDAAGVAGAPASELAGIVTRGERNPLLVTQQSDYPVLMKFAMSDPPWIPGPVIHELARQRIANQELERRIFQQIATDSVNDAVRGLATPTLIVWGDEDRLLSVGTVPILKTLLPNAQAIVMPHVGHAPMIERPQQAAEDYLRFRAQVTAPAAPRTPGS
jgi:pimeloyl-ACP methyl ester carboxylesterase